METFSIHMIRIEYSKSQIFFCCMLCYRVKGCKLRLKYMYFASLEMKYTLDIRNEYICGKMMSMISLVYHDQVLKWILNL